MSDLDFAIQIRRLLLSIAHAVKRKYDNEIMLVILTGQKQAH